MDNVENMETLDNTNDLFYDYFADMDLNSDIKKIYDVINDEKLQEEFEQGSKLNELRNENHKRYYAINTKKIENLPSDFSELIYDVLKLYNFIDSKMLLTESLEDAENSKLLLDKIYIKLDRIDKLVEIALRQLEKENDEKQSKFSVAYFKSLDIDDVIKEILLNRYNDLVLFNTIVVEDPYDNLKRQMLRKEYITDILSYLHIEQKKYENEKKKDKLKILNEKIDDEIKKYKEKIQYLEDIMPSGSKHVDEFNDFKESCNNLFAYDDTDYDSAKRTYEILSDTSRFKILTKSLEELFIEDQNNIKKEKEFVYEKSGIINVKLSLNYIYNYYYNSVLNDDEKKTVDDIISSINSDNYDLKLIEDKLGKIVDKIWKNSITDIYSYNPNENFYFICSSSQFLEEKHQAILISRKELDIVNDYSNYEIGFICGYNRNILYITENDNITSVNHNDMSMLKTPIQIEQEFIKLKICDRIALDGFRTKMEAVYCIRKSNNINDLNYTKALELANRYGLPLIELRKN